MPKGCYIPFTPAQERKIKREYLDKPVKVLAAEVACSYGRIMRFLAKNDLSIPRELVEQRKMIGRRKKGDAPFNKGLKQVDYMTADAIEKTKATRFCKGNVPHNVNPMGDGAIVERRDKTGRPYKYVRIALGKWRLYHRILWQQHYGPIPDDGIIVFKDGDSLNVTIENLELITLAENMLRNSKYNYPQDIIPSLLLVKQLETKLKTLQDGKE